MAIAPDLGERYLDTVYQTNWVQDLYGEDVLSSDELITASDRPERATDRNRQLITGVAKQSGVVRRPFRSSPGARSCAMTADRADPHHRGRGARPESSTERAFADVLAEVMGVERASGQHFFDDSAPTRW